MEKKPFGFGVDSYLLLEDLPIFRLNPRSSRPDANLQYPKNQETFQEEERNGTNKASNGDDRLSALPDILCQHIISFLPAKDARKTAFLSKQWRFMWCASPSFVFNEQEFKSDRQNFIRFVNETLQLRTTFFGDLTLDKFRVCMRFVEEVSPCLENWIAFALERNVKELSIVAEMKDLLAVAEFFHPFRLPYLLPQSIFTTKSIQYLELVFCDLTGLSGSSVDLPFLKNLDLVNVHMNDSTFESIVSGSPLLEKINLSLVCGLKNIHVPGLRNLKLLLVFKCLPLEQVIVTAPNIEAFLFRGKRECPDKIDISSCRKLKFLWLQRASNLSDDALEQIALNNPSLEIMLLIHCPALKKAVLQCPSLWMFVLLKCKHLCSVKIDAPKLYEFKYSGHMINFASVVSSGHFDAIIHMDGRSGGTHWYKRLKEMFTKFNHCRTLCIRCEHDVDLIVPHELRKRLLPQLHGLAELKITVRNGSTMNLSMLEDGIRWIYPGLKNLYVELDGSTHHFQYAGSTGDGGTRWRKCRDLIIAGMR